MRLKRTAAFALGGAAFAAWLAAAATSSRRAAPAAPVRVAASDPDVAALTAQISRLHDRLVPAATPVAPGRDLFRFADPPHRPAPDATRAAPAAAAPAAPVFASPPPPALKLDGIAEDNQPGGIVRTAIISCEGRLFLAREGDAVTSRFKITRISASVVELVDLTDNGVVRLPLP